MALKRMDNVLSVVEDLEAVKAFFLELGLELEGEATVEGPDVGRLIGLENVRATLAMLRPSTASRSRKWNPGLDEAKLGSAVIPIFHVFVTRGGRPCPREPPPPPRELQPVGKAEHR